MPEVLKIKRKPLIPLLVVLAAAFLWAVGPSVSFSFLLRSPIVLFRELVSLMQPTSTLDSTGPNASIFTLRRLQLLLESAAMNPAGTGGTGVAPRATTGSATVVSPTSVLSPTTVLNPASPNLLPSSITNNSVPTNPLTLPIGTVPDLLPTITAPSAPSTPGVTVPSTPSTPSVSVPSAPTPGTPSVGSPPAGGGTPSGGGGGAPGGIGGGVKLP